MVVQQPPRVGVATEELVVGTFEGDVAAIDARPGSHVDDVVGNANHLRVVLDEQHRVASVAQALDGMFHQLDVTVVEASAGLVEDVKHVGKRRVDVFRNLAPLGLAAREGAHGAVETQIAQANLFKGCQTRADSRLQVDGEGRRNRLHPFVQPPDAEGTGLGDVQRLPLASRYLAGEHPLVQACAVTVGTGAHA